MLISSYHHRRVKNYLFTNIPITKQMADDAKQFLGVESVPAVAIPLFDVLYNTSCLDPYVLRGINHLHHSHEFNNLDELINYMKDNIIKSAKDGDSKWQGIIDKYKGYTGEEYAFDNLRNSGADVIVPESGTNPGIDVISDNVGLDVKITSDPSYIYSELAQDPNKIILTNREMAPYFQDNERVIIDYSLSESDMFNFTDTAFESITDIGSYLDVVPIVTLATVGTKNTIKVFRGDKDMKTALEHTGLDTIGVGAGSLVGGQIGMALGLILAPATGGTSAIVIPAATTMIATISGIVASKSATNWIKKRHLRKAIKILSKEALEYRNLFIVNYNKFISDITYYFQNNINKTKVAKNQLQGWFMRTFFPCVLVKYYSLALKKIKVDNKNTIEFYSELKSLIEESDETEGGILLFNQGKEILLKDEELIAAYNKVESAYLHVKEEEKKLI